MDKDDDDDNITINPESSISYIAMSILCSSQNSLVPEILYLFSPEQIIKFIQIFGGETLYVPTPEEFSKDLMAGLACYHIMVEGKSWDWFQLYYNINGNIVRSLKTKIEKWLSQLSEEEKEFIETLKIHDSSQKKMNKLKKGDNKHG